MKQDEVREVLLGLRVHHAGLTCDVTSEDGVSRLRLADAASGREAAVSTPGDRWFALDVDLGLSLNHFEEEVPDSEVEELLRDYVAAALAYVTDEGKVEVDQAGARAVRIRVGDKHLELRRSVRGAAVSMLRGGRGRATRSEAATTTDQAHDSFDRGPSELDRHLDRIAQALGVDDEPRDWSDEHDRAELYSRAFPDRRLHDLLFAALGREPDGAVAIWALCGVVEHADPVDHPRWLALDAADLDRTRLAQLQVLHAVLGGAAVDAADVESWPDWLQRRVVARVDRRDVLRLLGAHGRSKRVRRTAGDRLRGRCRPSSESLGAGHNAVVVQDGRSSTIEDEVTRWALAAVQVLLGGRYVEQIDLDDLLGATYDERTAVPLGLDVLVIARAALTGMPDATPRLAVPLADSPTLDARAPALDDVGALHDTFHPPGLYVFRPSLEHLTGGWEEYRVGYDQVLQADDGTRMEASYSCWRGATERRDGWSFARTVWFDVRTEIDDGTPV